MIQVERAFETPRAGKADQSKTDRKLTVLREKLIAKNEVNSHNAIGHVTPTDYLAGLAPEIHAERDRKSPGGTSASAHLITSGRSYDGRLSR